MYQSKRRTLFPLLVSLTIFFSVDVFALEIINQSASVFKFQQTLANKGNGFAQYKLGTMYETGAGVDRDIEQAKQWYQRASSKGVKAASDRSIFLEVKEEGFNKSVHQSWVYGVQTDVKKRDIESMLLLGQMYHKGLGVEKNLERSLALLTYVNSSGGGNVEHDIELIQNEINSNIQAGARSREGQAKIEPRVKLNKVVEVVEVVEVVVDAAVETKQALLIEEQFMSDKKRRYEKFMAQIELEQQQINEQQARVTNGEVVAMDDEF